MLDKRFMVKSCSFMGLTRLTGNDALVMNCRPHALCCEVAVCLDRV
jgi:hypothetical protein